MTIAGQTFTVAQAGDAVPPTVSLTSPAAGIVSNTIILSATASDNVAVAHESSSIGTAACCWVR